MFDNQQSNILIVDDVEENRRILATIIKKNTNYDVVLARNGQVALEAIKKSIPDLILLDIMMPDLSGIEVCKIIKNDPVYSDIPIIMVTAKAEGQNVKNALEAGAIDYVKKPFSDIELLARINSALKLRSYVKELENALACVKTLSGLLPICANCKKIRDDSGYWQQVEEFMRSKSDLEFTHSICPDCANNLYPEINESKL